MIIVNFTTIELIQAIARNVVSKAHSKKKREITQAFKHGEISGEEFFKQVEVNRQVKEEFLKEIGDLSAKDV